MVIFLVNSHNWPSSPAPINFLLSLAGDGIQGGDLGHFRELVSFPVYLPRTHVIKLFVLLLLICLLLQRSLSQELKKEETQFALSYTAIPC